MTNSMVLLIQHIHIIKVHKINSLNFDFGENKRYSESMSVQVCEGKRVGGGGGGRRGESFKLKET